jgi:L-ascorbate metabolism protein UlaG (beta-lactamase superfamily)
MQITYLGHSSFKIKTKKAIIITDPFNDYIGFKMPKTKADIVTISHDHKDHNNIKAIEGGPFIIDAPGEYEVLGVSIFGISSFHDSSKGEERGKNTIYSIHAGGLTLCHLGDFGQAEITDKQLEEVNGVDVLFIPVGSTYTIGPKKAVKIINQIEPKIVIPMHYRQKGMSASFEKLFTLKDFLQEVEAKEVAKQSRLIVSQSGMPEERKIIPLSRK